MRQWWFAEINVKRLYATLAIVVVLLLAVGATLLFTQQSNVQSPAPAPTPDTQQEQQWQRDELIKQQQELQEQLQELQEQLDWQKQQMREHYLQLAREYEDKARVAEAQRADLLARKISRGGGSVEENVEIDRLYQLAQQYRQQAAYYRALAYAL